jgi:hypothetical protein
LFLIRGNAGSWLADGITCRLGRARQILIGSSAIRNPHNSRAINHLKIPNRLKTADSEKSRHPVRGRIPARRGSWWVSAPEPPPKLLIGSPVIRILPKRFGIKGLNFSNRRKTPCSTRRHSSPAEAHRRRVPIWLLFWRLDDATSLMEQERAISASRDSGANPMCRGGQR